jgi:hypothetical protein
MEPTLVSISRHVASTHTPLPFGENVSPFSNQFQREFESNTSTVIVGVSGDPFANRSRVIEKSRWASSNLQNPFFATITTLSYDNFGSLEAENNIPLTQSNQLPNINDAQNKLDMLVVDRITLNPISRKSLKIKFTNKRVGSINLYGEILKDPYER